MLSILGLIGQIPFHEMPLFVFLFTPIDCLARLPDLQSARTAASYICPSLMSKAIRLC
jgi:hypothetical protein